jgi:hypothetical protein
VLQDALPVLLHLTYLPPHLLQTTNFTNLKMENNHNNGGPPGWIFYPYPPLVVYPPPQVAQIPQAPQLPPPPPPEPAHELPPPGPAHELPPALPAQIKFVACHHCGVCGRPRSHAYHRQYPLIPGQVAPAGVCRKCSKKQDKGEPIDSIMLPVGGHVSEKGSSAQFYDPPSTEPSRGRLRSVSWRHVAPRAISRPRIESLDGHTNDAPPSPPPPAPSVPHTAPSDKVSRATSSAGSSRRTAHSKHAPHPLPKREIRETIEVRTREPLSPARETRSIIKASSKPLYRTPTPDSHGNVKHSHDHYQVRFERSKSRPRHALVSREQQALAPYYRHVEKCKETAPEAIKSTYHSYKRTEELEEEVGDTKVQWLHPWSKSVRRQQKTTSFNRFVLGLIPSCPTGN